MPRRDAELRRRARGETANAEALVRLLNDTASKAPIRGELVRVVEELRRVAAAGEEMPAERSEELWEPVVRHLQQPVTGTGSFVARPAMLEGAGHVGPPPPPDQHEPYRKALVFLTSKRTEAWRLLGRCRGCSAWYVERHGHQAYCSPDCANRHRSRA